MFDPVFFLLQENKLKRFLTIFQRGDWARILVMIAFVFIFLLLAVGAFFFSLTSFKFLGQYPEASQPVIIYTLAITFILTSVLTLASSIFTSLGYLFQKEDNSLVFSLPIETGTLFEDRLVEVVFLSSWPLLLFALPLILGYGVALSFDFFSTFLFLAGVLFLTLVTSLLGTVISLFLARLAGNLKNKVWGIVFLGALPLLAVALIKLLLPEALLTDLERLSLAEIAQLLNRQHLMAKFLPTTWLVNLVYFWHQAPPISLRGLLYLSFLFLGVLVLLLVLRGKFYLEAVNKTAEGRFIAAPWDVVRKKARPFPYFLRGKMGALTEKDWLIIFRSPPQLFQLGFIFFLEIVYFLILSRLPLERFQRLFPDWYQERLIKANFLFINYLVSVFAMRFFFPMLSLEGQSSWIVWSAPLARIKVFWQKFLSSFLIIFLWMEISTFISIKLLELTFAQAWPLLVVNLPLALTITMMTLGIGAIKPNFWERNPEKLSTSPGGVVATAFCLGYIALVSGLFFIQKSGAFFNPLIHLGIWLISLLLILPILAQVRERINKYEI